MSSELILTVPELTVPLDFHAAWGFYKVSDMPDRSYGNTRVDTSCATFVNWINSLSAIPGVGTIVGLAMIVFTIYHLCTQGCDSFSCSLLLKGTLSTLGLGPILLIVDLGIFFKRLHDAKELGTAAAA